MHRLRIFFSRLFGILNRRASRHDLDAELNEHLQLLAVLYRRRAVRHGGYAVAQKRLFRRDIHILRGGLWSKPGAPAEPGCRAH